MIERPFAIDWRGSPHTAGATPPGCAPLDGAVLHAPRPGLAARLDTPRGIVLLCSP